jgi:hypothetical protein
MDVHWTDHAVTPAKTQQYVARVANASEKPLIMRRRLYVRSGDDWDHTKSSSCGGTCQGQPGGGQDHVDDVVPLPCKCMSTMHCMNILMQ